LSLFSPIQIYPLLAALEALSRRYRLARDYVELISATAEVQSTFGCEPIAQKEGSINKHQKLSVFLGTISFILPFSSLCLSMLIDLYL
jgi:hypothetical protein